MDVMAVIFIILGCILFMAFVAWFYLVDQKVSKSVVLMCDTLLIVLSVSVLLLGLELRNRTLEETRSLMEQEVLEQMENETRYD